MIEYGYINENGSLVSKFLEEYSEKFKNEETGEIETRIVSIQEQQTELSALGWKHVELVDDTKLQCPEYYSVRIVPYDAGDKISYKYEQRFNAKLVRNKIDELKASLTSNDSVIGDYRITKCYEASLIGLDMPYDIENLHQQRQSVRDEINKLEALNSFKNIILCIKWCICTPNKLYLQLLINNLIKYGLGSIICVYNSFRYGLVCV